MAKEQGRVVKLVGTKPFGFIRRPDGSELFFHFSKYPSGAKPALGDELDYEVQIDSSKPAGKQDFAANITVTKKASATAPAPAPLANMASAVKPLDVIVEFLYDEGELIATEDVLELPTIVRVSNPDGSRLRGANLALWCDKRPYSNPEGGQWYQTDHKGEVPFILGYWRETDALTGQQGPAIKFRKLNLDVEVSYEGKKLMVSEVVPRSKDLKVQFVIIPEVKGAKVNAQDRFKVAVVGDVVIAPKFRAVISMDTFDEYGKPYESKVEATLVTGNSATFTDECTNAVLAQKACYCEPTTSADGSCRLGVEFKGQFEVCLLLRHPASNQKRTLTLVYKQ